MKVCVAISCYNQEKYIVECISHLLCQTVEKGTEIKILICDDASTDRTKELIEQTIEKVGLREGWLVEDHSNNTNMGMPENTKRILRLLMESQADYGCILEEDDYWISPFWLEKHMKPMNENPDITISNNYLMIYYQEMNRYEARQLPKEVHESPYISAEMQAEDNYSGNFSSNLYRISALRNIPKEFLEQPYVDDWFTNLLMAVQGKIASLKEPLSVYRVHSQGVWNGRKKKEAKEEGSISKRIRFMHEHYPGKYLPQLASFSERYAQIPMQGKIYYDLGKGYNESEVIPVYFMFKNRTHFIAEVKIPPEIMGKIRKLRFDPAEGYRAVFSRLQVQVNGTEAVEAVPQNGKVQNEKIVFDTEDPILALKISKKDLNELKSLTIDGDVEFS